MREFPRCFKEVLGVFQETFKGDSRELLGFKRSSKVVSRQFVRCFKEVSRVLKESVKCVSRKFC